MNEQVITSIMLITIGGFFLLRNIVLLRDEKKLREYLENSRKGRIWVSKFGVDKTSELSRKYFLPLGIVISAGLLIAGAVILGIYIFS